MPVFWLGFLLILAFAVEIRIFPPGGSVNLRPDRTRFADDALATSFVGVVVRFARASMLEVLGQDYIRTARAKGLPPRAIEYRHALRNALIPLVTVVGLQVGVLAIRRRPDRNRVLPPGLGLLMTNAVAARDYPLILGSVLVVAVLVVVANLAVDLLYGALDPRIRYD